MRVLITCGPSYEPLDQVRRLTNLSTGELGVRLAERLGATGASVVCLKGAGASFRDPRPPADVEHFTTNDDLTNRLLRRARAEGFHAVLHAAALCDFRVTRIEDSEGHVHTEGKIPSRGSEMRVHLAAAPKLIGDLRGLFPDAWIVGWKYEVDGTPEDAIRQGRRQMADYGTHACVVNGPACGSHWILCEPPDRRREFLAREELVEELTRQICARCPG